MTTKDFIEGLQIFNEYFDKHSYNFGAEHDQFFVYATDRPITMVDLQRLIELDWSQSQVEWADEDQFSIQDYDEDEGWSVWL